MIVTGISVLRSTAGCDSLSSETGTDQVNFYDEHVVSWMTQGKTIVEGRHQTRDNPSSRIPKQIASLFTLSQVNYVNTAPLYLQKVIRYFRSMFTFGGGANRELLFVIWLLNIIYLLFSCFFLLVVIGLRKQENRWTINSPIWKYGIVDNKKGRLKSQTLNISLSFATKENGEMKEEEGWNVTKSKTWKCLEKSDW